MTMRVRNLLTSPPSTSTLTSPGGCVGLGVLAMAVLVGCNTQPRIADHPPPTVTICIDTRDGESFTFNTSTARNARNADFMDLCRDVTDDQGNMRTLCNSDERTWLKCKVEGRR